MRCRACNCMIGVYYNKYGLEDMCSKCRGWVYSNIIDEDLQQDEDYSMSETVLAKELGLDPLEELDAGDSSDNIYDRNHDCDLFDSYGD